MCVCVCDTTVTVYNYTQVSMYVHVCMIVDMMNGLITHTHTGGNTLPSFKFSVADRVGLSHQIILSTTQERSTSQLSRGMAESMYMHYKH